MQHRSNRAPASCLPIFSSRLPRGSPGPPISRTRKLLVWSGLRPARQVREIRLSMTNDNLDALRFYQRRGFRIAAVRPGAVDAARRRKPSIAAVGDYGIARHDELELVRVLG